MFRIFAMTKPVDSTAAMILMDRGKLSPDTPVADILPAFGRKQVLEGFDADGKPRLRAPRTQATGLPTILSGLCEGLDYPLLFDPARELAAVLMTQTLPFVEVRFMGVYEAFERGVYRSLGR